MTAGRKRGERRAKHRPAAQEAPGRPGSGHDDTADPDADHDASTRWDDAREAGEPLHRSRPRFPRAAEVGKQIIAERKEREEAEQRARQMAHHAARRQRRRQTTTDAPSSDRPAGPPSRPAAPPPQETP